MSQFYFSPATIDPATTSGAELADWLSQREAADRSMNSGTSQPSYVVAGMEWLDTTVGTAWKKKFYDGAASLEEWTLNPTTDMFTYPAHRQSGDVTFDTGAQILLDDSITAAGPDLPWCFENDTDLGGYREAANIGVLASASAARFKWNTVGCEVHGTLLVTGDVTLNGSLTDVATSASAAGVNWLAKHDKTVAGAANDVPFSIIAEGRDSTGAAQNYGQLEVVVLDPSNGGEDGAWRWRVASNGTMLSKMLLDGETNCLRPASNAGVNALSLGTGLFRWQGIHLDIATEINWNNGAVRLTHDAGNDRLQVNGGGLDVSNNLTVNGADFSVTAGTGVVNTVAEYRVDGTKVVGNRVAGWGSPTGTLDRTAFNADTITLPQLAARVNGIITDLKNSHGLFGA